MEVIGSMVLSGNDDETFSALASHLLLDLVAVSTATDASLVEGDNRPFLQDGLQLLNVLQALGLGESAAHGREGLAVGENEDCPDGQDYVPVGVFESYESGVFVEGHLSRLFANKICYMMV